MPALLEKTSGYICLNVHNYYFSTDPYKTLHICKNSIGLALNGLFKWNAATFVFDLGYTALNIHEIWPRLLWGEHIFYIRAKMTLFFNIR